MKFMDEMESALNNVENDFQKLEHLVEVEKAIRSITPHRFSINLAAFKKYMPEIASFLENYQPKSLKIIATSSGVANVIDPETGVPFYGEDPFDDCLKQVEQFIDNPHFSNISYPENEENPLNFIHTSYMNKLWGTYLEYDGMHESLHHIPNYYPTLLMFGIGLGYQLGYLYERVKVELLYIVEPNCDVFYASVCCFDWASLLYYIDKEGLEININVGCRFEEFTHDFINSLFSKGNYRCSRVALYQHYPSTALTEVITNLEKNTI